MVWIDRLYLQKNRKKYIISKNCVIFSRRKNWTPTIMLLKMSEGAEQGIEKIAQDDQ